MNEMHVCRSCGYVTSDAADGGVATVCPWCCAATWMIVRSKEEFIQSLQGVSRKQALKVFRTINARMQKILHALQQPTAKNVH